MNSKPRAGDWVEVRSKAEILATLDAKGQLDGMPFMPEMLAFCGKRFQVYKRAHKTCDTVFPIRGRRVDRTAHLETRCDGQAHGGCQAGCLLFWKEAWLKPVEGDSPVSNPPATPFIDADLLSHTAVSDFSGGEPSYTCQATRLPYATSQLEWWDVRQYLEDYSSRNVSLGQLIGAGFYALTYNVIQSGIGVGPALKWLYDKFHWLWRGTPYPERVGTIPEGDATPDEILDLQPGELVRVKPYQEILRTLDTGSKNRGLYWASEMVAYCGGTYRVLKRVTKIINEKTGKMQEMKKACIILDSVVCQSRFSHCRLLCPRAIYPYWREIWLERVESTPERRPLVNIERGA